MFDRNEKKKRRVIANFAFSKISSDLRICSSPCKQVDRGDKIYPNFCVFFEGKNNLIRRSPEKIFKKIFRDDFLGLFAKVACRMRFPRRAEAILAMTPKRHSEAEPKNPEKAQHNDWILHFAFASFRMTIPALALVLCLRAISESWAACEERDFSCNGKTGESAYCCYRVISETNDGLKNIKIYKDPAAGNNPAVVGVSAFDGNNDIGSVTIEGITGFEDYAFCNASSLTEVKMPNVTSIGDSVFNGASSLTQLEIPDTMEYVGSDALRTYSNLTLIVPDSLDMSEWDTDALNDDGEGIVTFKCKGDQEACKKNLDDYTEDAMGISGNNIIFDAGDHKECFKTSNDGENVSYYHSGSECVEYNEDEGIICASDYADYNGNCYAELPFSKKRYTPAEANQWLKDGNDNFVIITFKK